VADKPKCYGVIWNGTQESPCRVYSCGLFDECQYEFSKGTLLSAQQQLGPKASLEQLAVFLNVPAESILLAMNFQQNIGVVPFPPPQKQKPVQTPEPVQKKKKPEKDIVKKSKRHGHPWGSGRDGDRWERERQKSELVRLLAPGMVIDTRWRGETYQLTVVNGGYKVGDETYPTLYAATVSIVGTKSVPKQLLGDGSRPEGFRQVCPYSGPKFWKLRSFLEDRDLVPAKIRKRKKKKR